MKNFEEAATNLLQMFKEKDFPKQIALTFIKRKGVIPSDKWSLCNRIIMKYVGGTCDARTYKQWKEVGRYVIKGAKAFNIIAPITCKVINKQTGEEEIKLMGFRGVPVFSIENTVGNAINEEIYAPIEEKLPPFIGVAEKLGIKIYWQPLCSNALGYYSITDKSITLCSQDYIVYFHELAHAIHDTIEPLKEVPDTKAEIVAELTAAILAEMLDITGYEVQSYKYIMAYIHGKDKKHVVQAVTGVLNIVEKIINKILQVSYEI